MPSGRPRTQEPTVARGRRTYNTDNTDGAAWAAAGLKLWAYIDWAAAGIEANDQIVRYQPVVGGAIALTVLRGSDRLVVCDQVSSIQLCGRGAGKLTVLRGSDRLIS